MFHVRPSHDFAWIEERTGCVLTRNARAIEAYDERSGRRVGMVAYDCWTNTAVQGTIALEHPIAWRALRRPTFAYPFEECGKELMLVLVNSQNARSLALVRHSGFKETHRIVGAVDFGVDLIMFEMRRRYCRWLKER